MSRDVKEVGMACVLSESDRVLENAYGYEVQFFIWGGGRDNYDTDIPISIILSISYNIV